MKGEEEYSRPKTMAFSVHVIDLLGVIRPRRFSLARQTSSRHESEVEACRSSLDRGTVSPYLNLAHPTATLSISISLCRCVFSWSFLALHLAFSLLFLSSTL